jgi:hypothetical protein
VEHRPAGEERALELPTGVASAEEKQALARPAKEEHPASVFDAWPS